MVRSPVCFRIARSSGAYRPCCSSVMRCQSSAAVADPLRQISVAIAPGSTTTTSTPKGRTSRRSASLIASMANLEAEYAP